MDAARKVAKSEDARLLVTNFREAPMFVCLFVCLFVYFRPLAGQELEENDKNFTVLCIFLIRSICYGRGATNAEPQRGIGPMTLRVTEPQETRGEIGHNTTDGPSSRVRIVAV